MFWDNVACVYDVFANVINRKTNEELCSVVKNLILPEYEKAEHSLRHRITHKRNSTAVQKPCCNGFFRKNVGASKEKVP